MSQELEIRPLTGQDYAEFRALRLEHLELESQSVATSAKDWREAPREQVMALLSFEGLREHNFMMGAFQGDKLVGHIGFNRNIHKMQTAHKGVFWGFYVTPEHRNQGVGTRLVKESMDVARSYAWCEMIRTQITTTDAFAIQVAKRFGFERMGVELKNLKVGDVYFDTYTYITYF